MKRYNKSKRFNSKVPKQKINIRKIKAAHKRLNWSTTILNSLFRNAFYQPGKWVAATDADLIIYTRKGPAFLLEQKNMLSGLESMGYIETSKVQLDVLLDVCEQLRPRPALLLVVYDAEDADKNKRDTIIYVAELTRNILSNLYVTGSPRRYKINKSIFAKQRFSDLLDKITNTIALPQWSRLPNVIAE